MEMLVKLPKTTLTGNINVITFYPDKVSKNFRVRVDFENNSFTEAVLTGSKYSDSDKENEDYCEKMNSALFDTLKAHNTACLFGTFVPILEITKDGEILNKLTFERDPR